MNEQQLAFVRQTLDWIEEEAQASKPAGMSSAEAIDILITDRQDRFIYNAAEAAEARRMAAERSKA